MSIRPKILVTNDDGIDGEGLAVLAKALETVADVYVLAPCGNRSAVSSHLTLNEPMRIVERRKNWYLLHGYPVDCVITALRSDLFGVQFDAVVSGINKGANMGTDLVYSGTAAAARQAALYGVPGIALSLERYDADDWNFAPLADFAAKNLHALMGLCSKDVFVNVNAASRASYTGVAFTTLSKRDYIDTVKLVVAPNGERYGFLVGEGITTSGQADSDYHAVRDGKISVTLVCTECRIEKSLTETQRSQRWIF